MDLRVVPVHLSGFSNYTEVPSTYIHACHIRPLALATGTVISWVHFIARRKSKSLEESSSLWNDCQSWQNVSNNLLWNKQQMEHTISGSHSSFVSSIPHLCGVKRSAESPLQNTKEKAGDIASWRGKGDQYKAETGSRCRRGQDSARVTVRVRGWEVTVVIISCSC